MANKVSQEDIKRFNELYAVCHNYSQVARDTGFSPATIKRYIVPNYVPAASIKIERFDRNLITEVPDWSIFRGVKNWGDLCVYSQFEKIELENFKKELSL